MAEALPDAGGRELQWLSCHLYYYAQGGELLLRLVLPVVVELWRGGKISSFFFVRYQMGGPHIRLRLLCRPETRGEVEELLLERAAEFFERWPSRVLLEEAEIRERNRLLLATSPGEDDVVYPDNSLARIPFHPETERYGGPELLGHSLAFFAVSSACALSLLRSCEGESRSRSQLEILRTLIRQAVGCTTEGAELGRLLAYACPANPERIAALIDRADQDYERSAALYDQVFGEEVEAFLDPGSAGRPEGSLLASAARRLRRCIREVAPESRWTILSSQLHMTANRLGMTNFEEIFYGRILGRAVQDFERAHPALLAACLGQADVEGDLEDLVGDSFETVLAPPREALA